MHAVLLGTDVVVIASTRKADFSNPIRFVPVLQPCCPYMYEDTLSYSRPGLYQRDTWIEAVG